MNEAAEKLRWRVTLWQGAFSAGTAILSAALAPRLLLLHREVVVPISLTFAAACAVGGVLAIAWTQLRLRRYRFVLRALALGSRSVEAFEMSELGEEPPRAARAWLLPHLAAISLLAGPWRPPLLDVTAGLSAALLAGVIVAAAALPLSVLIRSAFVRAIELAPPEVMREVVEEAELAGRASRRIARRLLTAVATPVAFVALGAALIAGAHIRRADEHSREETARALARISLELGPGVVAGAGLADAIQAAEQHGFSARLRAETDGYGVRRSEGGMFKLSIPLDAGSAEVRFRRSTIPVLSSESLLIALLAVTAAAGLGLGLARIHTDDLIQATRGIQMLGTETVLSGAPLTLRPARFRIVAELESAIERLALRFRVFAQAQERAIEAREAATRTRGLFFASVSHDLKNPLNAILGFAELVKLEPLTPGQTESLEVIDQRGRELLALIETILDAARVEAGQLSLVAEEMSADELIEQALVKARDLTGDRHTPVVGEVAEGVGILSLDRIRAGRAVATLIGYAMRESAGRTVYVRAMPADPGLARLEVELPAGPRTAELERLLARAGHPGTARHRGLALGVSLARSVMELHGGSVEAVVSDERPLFRVTLPMRRENPPSSLHQLS